MVAEYSLQCTVNVPESSCFADNPIITILHKELIKTEKINNNKIKALAVTAAVGVLMLCGGCDSSLIQGEEGMLEYARQAHGEGLEYAGSVSDAGETIAWFTADPSHPVSFPIIFSNKGNNTYKFANDPNISHYAGACHLVWHHGLAIHVEDPDIAEIKVVSGNVTIIPVTELPFNTYWERENGSITNIYYYDSSGDIVNTAYPDAEKYVSSQQYAIL